MPIPKKRRRRRRKKQAGVELKENSATISGSSGLQGALSCPPGILNYLKQEETTLTALLHLPRQVLPTSLSNWKEKTSLPEGLCSQSQTGAVQPMRSFHALTPSFLPPKSPLSPIKASFPSLFPGFAYSLP